MAQFGSGSAVITMDDSGGTPRIITPYVDTIGEYGIEQINEKSNPFGTTAEEVTPVGMAKSMVIPIGGLLNDAATVGPHVVFKTPSATPATATRTLVIANGGATFTIEGHPSNYKVGLKNGALTRWSADFTTSGIGVWS